jgi:hypothetical protein
MNLSLLLFSPSVVTTHSKYPKYKIPDDMCFLHGLFVGDHPACRRVSHDEEEIDLGGM